MANPGARTRTVTSAPVVDARVTAFSRASFTPCDQMAERLALRAASRRGCMSRPEDTRREGELPRRRRGGWRRRGWGHRNLLPLGCVVTLRIVRERHGHGRPGDLRVLVPDERGRIARELAGARIDQRRQIELGSIATGLAGANRGERNPEAR